MMELLRTDINFGKVKFNSSMLLFTEKPSLNTLTCYFHNFFYMTTNVCICQVVPTSKYIHVHVPTQTVQKLEKSKKRRTENKAKVDKTLF